MLISTGNLTREALAGQVIIVTGAGKGIGYEAARAMVWLGARAIIAEIDRNAGAQAAKRIQSEFGSGSATFIHTDVGDEGSVARLARQAFRSFGRVDVVFNNATLAMMGAVQDRPIRDWDASYRVNLRGPVLLARAFLPAMVQRNSGIYVCVSSTGGPYMSAYESFKSAQVELARALDAELEGTDVCAYTIGPGLVPTDTAKNAIGWLAPRMGQSVEEFFEAQKSHVLSIEAAGAGFAASVALASRYRGQEIGGHQALIDANIDFEGAVKPNEAPALSAEEMTQALELCRQVLATLDKYVTDLKDRSLFERQWVLRDFKQRAGRSTEEWLNDLRQLENALATGDAHSAQTSVPLERLAGYYHHLQDLARGYVKDSTTLHEYLGVVQTWEDQARELGQIIK
jgi:NAD(P)-dependent dehydrogenase (short-subunit alcohol dehydrogenase family)